MPKVIFNIAYTSKHPPAKLDSKKKAAYLARRSFYNMTAEYNYFSYTLNGEKVVKNKDMFSYMTNEEKSTGAFNLKGSISKEELDDIQKRIKATDSHIWHGVISFDEETSKGFKSQKDAVRFLNQSFNAFLDRTHLKKSNLEIIASLHKDTDNRHIHFTFFEKEPKRRNKNGVLGYTTKATFEQKALENYLVSANMYMSDHSEEYYTARDRAMDKLKSIRANAAEKLTEKALLAQINALASKLPTQGRLQYNSDNMKHLRKEIDEVALLLIKSDPEAAEADKAFRVALAKKENEARDICFGPVSKQLQYVNNRELKTKEVQQLLKEGKTEFIRANNIKWENIDYFEQLRQDYKARCGNQLLGLIKDLRKSKKEKNRKAFNDRQKKLQARNKRRHNRKVLFDFMKLLGSYQQGIKADFSDRLHQIENQIHYEQNAQAE